MCKTRDYTPEQLLVRCHVTPFDRSRLQALANLNQKGIPQIIHEMLNDYILPSKPTDLPAHRNRAGKLKLCKLYDKGKCPCR